MTCLMCMDDKAPVDNKCAVGATKCKPGHVQNGAQC
jgi:hypothetical protein